MILIFKVRHHCEGRREGYPSGKKIKCSPCHTILNFFFKICRRQKSRGVIENPGGNPEFFLNRLAHGLIIAKGILLIFPTPHEPLLEPPDSFEFQMKFLHTSIKGVLHQFSFCTSYETIFTIVHLRP